MESPSGFALAHLEILKGKDQGINVSNMSPTILAFTSDRHSTEYFFR